MSLFDGFVALVVLIGFGWIIFTSVAKKNPRLKEWVKDLRLYDKVEEKENEIKETTQQIFSEKRSMM